MARFLELGCDLINVDHILRLELHKDGRVTLHFDNGKKLESDEPYMMFYRALRGQDHVVATTPCQGIYAIIEGEDKTSYYPVHQLAVTAAGEVRPLYVRFETIEFMDAMQSYRGLTDQPK